MRLACFILILCAYSFSLNVIFKLTGSGDLGGTLTEIEPKFRLTCLSNTMELVVSEECDVTILEDVRTPLQKEDSYCQQLEEAEAWQEQVMNDEFRNVVETVVAIKRVFC